MLHTDQYWW